MDLAIGHVHVLFYASTVKKSSLQFIFTQYVVYSSEQKLYWPFQIAYEGDFRSLCTVTFGQKVDCHFWQIPYSREH